MMKLFCSALALMLLGVAPVWAQEEAAPTEEVVMEAAPAEDTRAQEVWRGNRSISYGNYLKFDRIQVGAVASAPAAPTGPVVMDTLDFERDKAVLSPSARAIVDDAIRILRANPSMSVQVEVQAGVQAMTGRRLTLSQQRTDAVSRYLAENGIAAHRITVSSGTSAYPTNAVVIPISGN